MTTHHNTLSFLNKCYLEKKETGIVFPWWLEVMIYVNDRFFSVKDEYYPGCLPRKLRKFLEECILGLDHLIQPYHFSDEEDVNDCNEDFDDFNEE